MKNTVYHRSLYKIPFCSSLYIRKFFQYLRKINTLLILICAKSHSRCWVMINLRCVKISFKLLNDRSQLVMDVQMVNMSCKANLRFGKVSLPYSIISFSNSVGDDTGTLDRTLNNDMKSVISNRRSFSSTSEY